MSFLWGNASTPTPTPAETPPPQLEVQASTPEDPERPATRQLTGASETPYDFKALSPAARRRDIARERLRRASRSRTPSPQPRDSPTFHFPSTSTANMDEATVQRLMEAVIRATQTASTQQVQTLRKPELPVFDKKNVEIWIKRVEAAYARVHCTSPALKFAHLDAKFEVNADPIVDGYLFGDPTEENWNAFLNYLRKRYAPTKKDQALTVINGTPREGRTPSQLAAVMKEKAGSVTIDDILKEQLLKQLPPDVLKHLVDRVDSLTFEETAKLADAWFDRDGKPLIQTSATAVNHVAPGPPRPTPSSTPSTASASAAAPSTPSSHFTPVFDHKDEDTDVNAIRFRQGQKQQFNINNRGGARGRGRGNGNRNAPQNKNTNSFGNSASYSAPPSSSKKKICDFHIKFGDEARRCEEWCLLWNAAKHTPKGKPAPRA